MLAFESENVPVQQFQCQTAETFVFHCIRSMSKGSMDKDWVPVVNQALRVSPSLHFHTWTHQNRLSSVTESLQNSQVCGSFLNPASNLAAFSLCDLATDIALLSTPTWFVCKHDKLCSGKLCEIVCYAFQQSRRHVFCRGHGSPPCIIAASPRSRSLFAARGLTILCSLREKYRCRLEAAVSLGRLICSSFPHHTLGNFTSSWILTDSSLPCRSARIWMA